MKNAVTTVPMLALFDAVGASACHGRALLHVLRESQNYQAIPMIRIIHENTRRNPKPPKLLGILLRV